MAYPYKHKDMIVVIRTAGERTVEICKKLVCTQIDDSMIHVIEEKPFFNAVKKTILTGSQNRAKYLLALDADILLYPEAIDYMIYQANQIDFDSHLKISFWVLDKFRGRFKSGIHLYNNKYSEEFYGFLSQIDPNENFLRPESENIKKFASLKGLRFSFAPEHIIGKHDFFQYYRDLYSKYRLRYKRCLSDGNADSINRYINEKWAQYPDDKDYVFVREIFGSAETDITLDDILRKFGLSEKEPLNLKMFDVIAQSLAGEQVMRKVKEEINLKLKNWIGSYNEIKDFITRNYRLDTVAGDCAVYGTGDICDLILSAGKHLRIKAIIDNNPEKHGTYINGIPVISINQAQKLNIKNILIGSVSHKDEIRNRINNTLVNNNLNLIAPDSI